MHTCTLPPIIQCFPPIFHPNVPLQRIKISQSDEKCYSVQYRILISFSAKRAIFTCIHWNADEPDTSLHNSYNHLRSPSFVFGPCSHPRKYWLGGFQRKMDHRLKRGVNFMHICHCLPFLHIR